MFISDLNRLLKDKYFLSFFFSTSYTQGYNLSGKSSPFHVCSQVLKLRKREIKIIRNQRVQKFC